MDFTTAVKTCFSKYATFKGIAHRPEYWWFFLFQFLGQIVFGILDAILFGAEPTSGPLATIFSLAVLLPALAVGARRLHDIGRSGWWLLIGLFPVVGWLVLIWWFTRPGKTEGNPFAAG